VNSHGAARSPGITGWTGDNQRTTGGDNRLRDRCYCCLTYGARLPPRLAARNVKTGRGALSSDVRGEVETEEGVLVIRRIFVHHRVMAPEDLREVVAEVHTSYPMRATDLSLVTLAAESRYSRAHSFACFGPQPRKRPTNGRRPSEIREVPFEILRTPTFANFNYQNDFLRMFFVRVT